MIVVCPEESTSTRSHWILVLIDIIVQLTFVAVVNSEYGSLQLHLCIKMRCINYV